jgi:hypothetical protein
VPESLNEFPQKQRAQGMPGGSATTHGPACKWKKHTSKVTTGEAVSPAFPAQWF